MSMSGILWPVGFLLGRETTKASCLRVGMFVRGKNGYVQYSSQFFVMVENLS